MVVDLAVAHAPAWEAVQHVIRCGGGGGVKRVLWC